MTMVMASAVTETAADLPMISDEQVRALVADMNRTGFGVIRDYVPAESLSQLRAFVEAAVAKAGYEYVGFTGRASVAGTLLDRLAGSDAFKSLFTRMYEFGTGRAAPPVNFYQLLRCLTGQSGQKHSLRYHYDSFVITALLPVAIPTEGQAGDLLMLPNTRAIRRFYASNLLDKIFLDGALGQKVLKALVGRGIIRPTRIKMVPGNLYFFWGYRSIHTNEPCDPDKIRSTALFHYADPHAASSLRRMMGRQDH